MSIAIRVIALAVLLAGCESAGAPVPTEPPSTELPRTPVLSLEFWQDDAAVPLRPRLDGDQDILETRLDAAPFEVRLPKRSADVAVRLCAWTDQSIFVLEPAQQVDAVPYFRPGTGFADEASGRMTLFVGNDGHNHMAEERIASHSSDQEKILFESISLDGEPATGDVFVTAFMDQNTNELVDAGEFEYLRIQVV